MARYGQPYMFYKDLLAKVGVEMQVFRVGTYKSAGRTLHCQRNEQGQQGTDSAYMQSLWNQIASDVSASRHLSTDSLNMLADKNMDYCAGSRIHTMRTRRYINV